jgi:hypothetical protein
MKRKMDKNKLKEIIREIVDKVLAENAPAPAPAKPKEKEKETPTIAPGKPTKKPGPFSPDKGKNPIPKHVPAKATKGLNEEEMLNKIVSRFKSKK